MRIRLLLLLLSMTFSFSVLAQKPDYVKEMEQNDLRIRQKPNTEELLSDYLRSVGIKEDTVYAILYSPSQCLRCEAAIPAFYKKLKRNNPTNKLLLITAYKDSATALWYNTKNKFKADYYLYDSKSEYNRIFSFNTEGINGLYILKICPKEGIFVTGGQYTVLGAAFVSQLRARKERLAPHLYELDKKDSSENDDQQVESLPAYNWKSEDIPIDTKKNVISSVYDIPKIENGHFFFNDMLNNGIMLFKQQGNKFLYQTLFQADSIEKKKYIFVSADHFKNLEEQGQVFYIALSANMLDRDHIGISYSLPKILEKTVDNELNFSFYNAPAILIRDVNNFTAGKMISPDFDLEHSKYFYLHFSFDLFDHKLWFGCEKLTWPMDGFEKEDIVGKKDLNPFSDEFYNSFNPIMASFNITNGKCDGHYGKLEESQRRSKTGYYFLNNVFAHDGKYFLYGNGYTGKLYLSDSLNIGKVDKTYTVFNIDSMSIPQPDTTKYYQHEYGNLYDKCFYRCITVVKMNEHHIYCLLKYGMPRADNFLKNRYSFIVVDRKNGKVKEYPLPSIPSGDECLGYGINVMGKNYNPFIFIRSGKMYKIRNLKL